MNSQKKGKAISPKRLTKELIDKFSVLNGAKYFSLRIFKIYVVFIPAKKYIKYFIGTTRIELVLKIWLNEATIFINFLNWYIFLSWNYILSCELKTNIVIIFIRVKKYNHSNNTIYLH